MLFDILTYLNAFGSWPKVIFSALKWFCKFDATLNPYTWEFLTSVNALQEIYALYNRKEVVQETIGMKLIGPVLLMMQIFELICYIYLFGYIARHDKKMKEEKIISIDLFKERKQRNVFSLNAQIFGCALEILYQIVVLIIRFMGTKFFPNYSDLIRSYINFFFITQFATTSTLQILVSPDLRKKFFSLFKR